MFRCLLDLLGAAAAGLNEAGVRAVRAMALEAMGGGTVPVWFTGRTGSVIGAAWANSAAAAALDLDDGHRLARGHPGAAVIPAALAVAHEMGSTLEEVLSAIAIGYEVGVTIGAARVDYGNTGTWSSYAVVATAGALRRTPAAVLAHALAIAGESAPNQRFASAPPQVLAPEGSDVKEGIPWSVVTGLTALGLAQAGHTGPRNLLDSELHYRFAGDLPAPGEPGHIRNTYFKLYACCRHVHAPLDALLGLIEARCIDPASIDAIEVDTYSGALRISNLTKPANLVDVQYSIPYGLALAAIDGATSLLPLTADALGRDDVAALASKVVLRLDPALDASFPARTLARVTVSALGERFVSEVTSPRGEASDPLSWDELEDKFAALTRRIAPAQERGQVLSGLAAARTGDLSTLTRTLRGLDWVMPS